MKRFCLQLSSIPGLDDIKVETKEATQQAADSSNSATQPVVETSSFLQFCVLKHFLSDSLKYVPSL